MTRNRSQASPNSNTSDQSPPRSFHWPRNRYLIPRRSHPALQGYTGRRMEHLAGGRDSIRSLATSPPILSRPSLMRHTPTSTSLPPIPSRSSLTQQPNSHPYNPVARYVLSHASLIFQILSQRSDIFHCKEPDYYLDKFRRGNRSFQALWPIRRAHNSGQTNALLYPNTIF